MGGYSSSSYGALVSYSNLNITTSDNNPYSGSLNIIAATKDVGSYCYYGLGSSRTFTVSNGNILMTIDSVGAMDYGISAAGPINFRRGNIAIKAGTLNQGEEARILDIRSNSSADLNIGIQGDDDSNLKLNAVSGVSTS